MKKIIQVLEKLGDGQILSKREAKFIFFAYVASVLILLFIAVTSSMMRIYLSEHQSIKGVNALSFLFGLTSSGGVIVALFYFIKLTFLLSLERYRNFRSALFSK